MNIVSVGKNVVVEPMKDLESARITALGLHTPEDDAPCRIGKIISLPAEVNLEINDYDAEEEEIILFKPHGNELFKDGEKRFLIVPVENVIGYVAPDEDEE